MSQSQPQQQQQTITSAIKKQKKSNGYKTSYEILKCITDLNNKQIKFQGMIKGKRSCNIAQNTRGLNNETRNLKAIKGVYYDLNTFTTVDNIVKITKYASPTVRNHLWLLRKLGLVENNTLLHSYYITDNGVYFMEAYEKLTELYPLSYLNMFSRNKKNKDLEG